MELQFCLEDVRLGAELTHVPGGAGPAPGRAPASRPPARPPPRTPHPHPLPQTETCSPAIIHTHPLFKLSHKSTYSGSFSHSNSLEYFKTVTLLFRYDKNSKRAKNSCDTQAFLSCMLCRPFKAGQPSSFINL